MVNLASVKVSIELRNKTEEKKNCTKTVSLKNEPSRIINFEDKVQNK